MNRSLPSLIAGALLVVVLALYMITYQVRFTQVAVLKTFGKSAAPTSDDVTKNSGDVIREPGLYWKWPWPIQKVDHYDNRIQLSTNPGQETPTADSKPIIVTTTVAWRIRDPFTFDRRCGSMPEGATRLLELVRNYQTTAISKFNFNNFVSTNPAELKYDEIERLILQSVKAQAAEQYGIDVQNVGMERLALPQRITETVFDAMKQERKAMVAKFESEGTAQASQIKARAEGIANTITAFADGKAQEIVNEGLAQANKYYDVFKQDEELAVFLLKVQSLPQILKPRETTVIFDQNSWVFDLLSGTGNKPVTLPNAAPRAEAPSADASASTVPHLTK